MKSRKMYGWWVGLLLAFVFLSACSKQGPYTHYQPVQKYPGSVYDFLASQPSQFKNVMFVLEKAGLATLLRQGDSLTFFAPTDQSLLAAMDRYNIFRRSQQLPPVTMDDIDSTSWRYILLPYCVEGILASSDFDRPDGRMMRTMAMRDMHGALIRHNASGAKALGSATIYLSSLNGSRFERDWISANVATPDIQVDNGRVHILENWHVLGFNYFNDKAGRKQNRYSEQRTFATGSISLPNTTVRLWQDRVKALTAVGENSVETQAADAEAGDLWMRLTVVNKDSIYIRSAPRSEVQSIENAGPCYLDLENLRFVLHYRYEAPDGFHVVAENISYTAESAYVH